METRSIQVNFDDKSVLTLFNFFLLFSSTVFGMCFGLICVLGHKFHLYEDAKGGPLWPRPISLLAGLAAFVGLAAYTLFAFLCTSKQDCNEIHPYIAFVPVSKTKKT